MMFHRTAENQEPSVAAGVDETLPRDWFSDTESLEDPIFDNVSKTEMENGKMIKHSRNKEKDDNDGSVSTFPEDLVSCEHSLDDTLIHSISKTKKDQKGIFEDSVNEDNDDDNGDASAATPLGDLCSYTESLDESLIYIVSKTNTDHAKKIIERSDNKDKGDTDFSVSAFSGDLFSCAESIEDSLLDDVSNAKQDQTTTTVEKRENVDGNGPSNIGGKDTSTDLRSDERRATDGREVTVIASIICPRGTEDAGILAGKIRAVKVLQQEGCLWFDQCISEMEDGLTRITALSCWKDIDLFRLWMVSSDSIQFYTDNIDLAVPNSFQVAQFTRVENPFYVLKGRQRTFHNEELSISILPQRSAFSVIIVFVVRANRRDEFKRKAWSSEACAVQEEECLRYNIYVDFAEQEEEGQKKIYNLWCFSDKRRLRASYLPGV